MEEPTCPRCKTDKYLQFTRALPPWTEQRSFPAQGGRTISKPFQHAGEVEYFCHACGLERGHSVPHDWVGPVVAPDISELVAGGDYWPEPGQHSIRQSDGTTVIKVGRGR